MHDTPQPSNCYINLDHGFAVVDYHMPWCEGYRMTTEILPILDMFDEDGDNTDEKDACRCIVAGPDSTDTYLTIQVIQSEPGPRH